MPRRSSIVRQTIGNQVSLGAIAKEELPLSIVYYPNHYGTFLAFAKNKSGPVFLCACSKAPIENFLRLEELLRRRPNTDELRSTPCYDWVFPDVVTRALLDRRDNPLKAISFKRGLCHRCNLAAPSLRWCLEMYGGEFVQRFGWYMNQTYLRLGIDRMDFHFLPDICPPVFQKMIEDMKVANEEYERERHRLQGIASGPKRADIPDTEVTYWSNVKVEEAQEMIALRRKASAATTLVKNTLEDITRKQFGYPKVGEGWISETLLYQIVKRIFPAEKIVRHYRPEWMEGLELDIFLPKIAIAFEYQGQQHFHPIEAWGGSKALLAVKNRDARKAKICGERGIRLIAIDYTEPLTEEYISAILKHDIAGSGGSPRLLPNRKGGQADPP